MTRFMTKEPDLSVNSTLNLLETRIEELLVTVIYLKKENHLLQNKQDLLENERHALEQKTSVAKTRVEAMISRLKSMEINL